jgi:cytochrome b561
MTTMHSDVHPRPLIILHWAMAGLIVALLAVGFLMSGADPESATRLWLSRAHVALGVSTGVALIARVIVRRRSAPVAPLPMSGVRRALQRVVHGGIYAALFAMLASGIATCALGDWSSYVVFGTATSAPDLHAIAPREGHELFAFALMGLIGVHVAGVLLHQVRLGGALRRMLPTRE